MLAINQATLRTRHLRRVHVRFRLTDRYPHARGTENVVILHTATTHKTCDDLLYVKFNANDLRVKAYIGSLKLWRSGEWKANWINFILTTRIWYDRRIPWSHDKQKFWRLSRARAECQINEEYLAVKAFSTTSIANLHNLGITIICAWSLSRNT